MSEDGQSTSDIEHAKSWPRVVLLMLGRVSLSCAILRVFLLLLLIIRLIDHFIFPAKKSESTQLISELVFLVTKSIFHCFAGYKERADDEDDKNDLKLKIKSKKYKKNYY